MVPFQQSFQVIRDKSVRDSLSFMALVADLMAVLQLLLEDLFTAADMVADEPTMKMVVQIAGATSSSLEVLYLATKAAPEGECPTRG
jgi:hypothetical protein